MGSLRLNVALGNDEGRKWSESQEEKDQCEIDHGETALKALLHYLEADGTPRS